MSSLDRYKEETAHLTEHQRMLYEAAEYVLMSLSQTTNGFHNSIVAIETLAKTMRLSTEALKRRYH
jgi:hypothetical protein